MCVRRRARLTRRPADWFGLVPGGCYADQQFGALLLAVGNINAASSRTSHDRQERQHNLYEHHTCLITSTALILLLVALLALCVITAFLIDHTRIGSGILSVIAHLWCRRT